MKPSLVKFSFFFLIAALIAVPIGFLSPIYESYLAKKYLKDLGVDYSEQQFVQKACEGDEGSVLLFIKSGININAKSSPGKNDTVAKGALHCAALRGEYGLAKLIVDAGGNIMLKDDSGNAPLYYASRSAPYEMQRKNKDAKATTEIVEFFVNHGADVNDQGENGTALFAALQSNYTEAADFLIAHGANAKTITKEGLTPLMAMVMFSSRQPQTQIKTRIKSILDAGADINARDNNGNTALLTALSRGNKEATEALLAAGADPNISDNSGSSPLDRSINNPDTFKLISDAGGLPGTSKNGYPILHMAVMSQNKPAIQMILDSKKFDINAKNSEGNTALHFAFNRFDSSITNSLIMAGADLNSINNNLQTPLFFAVNANNYQGVKMLIEFGANLNVRDSNDRTALYYAKARLQNTSIPMNMPGYSRLGLPNAPTDDSIVNLLTKSGAKL